MDSKDVKPTNPKDQVAVAKLPLHLVPDTMKIFAALAFAEGAAKYGAFNWRVSGVRASVYLSALERHLMKWRNGEERDPDTNVPHLSNALACIAIILDARAAGKLVDDRPPALLGTATMINASEGLVRDLFKMHEDKAPKHYTIEDAA